MNAVRIETPVIVRWTGDADEAVRRAVEAAVIAGVRQALGAPAASSPVGAAPENGAWGADPDSPLWTLPSFDAGGAPVAVPVRLPRGDVLIRSPFAPQPVIRLSAAAFVWTGGDLHLTSSSLARAVQWGRALYGAHGFAVLEQTGDHVADRFVMTPLEAQLRVRDLGRLRETPPEGAPAIPGLRRTEVGEILKLRDMRVVLAATGDGHFVYNLKRDARWEPADVQREFARTPSGERADPADLARVATEQLTAAGTGAEPGTSDDDVLAARIVTMDRDVFAAMPWEQRAAFLLVLGKLWWPSARQKKAIVELLASARTTSELEAMAAILRAAGGYERLFATLDGDIVELLLLLGRSRPIRPMSLSYVLSLFLDLQTLPVGGIDPLRHLRNQAGGVSLWVRSTIDGLTDLFTHSPAELLEGIGHLAEFALVVQAATRIPPDPAAVMMLVLIAGQAGEAIRTAMAGLEYAEQLGQTYGKRGSGARISGDLAERLETALVVEILSWFVGIGEIRAALKGVQLTDRVAALLKVLSSLGRLGKAAEVAEEIGKLDRFVSALTKLAQLRNETAAAQALRLLPAGHLSEISRLAELLDVPAGASRTVVRRLAKAQNVTADVERLADALALARRFDRRAAQVGGITGDMVVALRKLLDTGWPRGVLANLVEAVPAERLALWSRAVGTLRPGQVERLGARYLEALAYWERSLAFVADAGGDVYLTLLRRNGGDTRAVDMLLEILEARRAEIGDPAAYQRLLDRIAAGEAAALEELSARISQMAAAVTERLRAGSRQQLLAELAEFDEEIARLRRQNRVAEAAEVAARRDRLAARFADLTDQELSGLDRLAKLADDTGDFAWDTVLDLAAADRGDMLRLIDDIAGRLPTGRLTGIGDVLRNIFERQVGKAGRFQLAVQGGWGELYAARTLIAEFGATALEFQAPRTNRVVDILADLPRGRVSVEVKTNLGDLATVSEPQLLKDLVSHAGTGYDDLLYLYHPSVAGEMPSVGRRMLALFDDPAVSGSFDAKGLEAAKKAFQKWLDAGNPRTYRL
ncbi:hypothetical protein KOI35_42605 [Actinoplanes bogorensis]|uniref:Uncharacterized protein n=1 Tax=Paractinoplanes bogorensis TaxID=1610840 RepID=A0ABS5Z3H2_9ACTN|nr:hypothetical protein [Actinoplanes bogorensis]MBU2670213.1 hypothetical protein [Actinoplanes bogorensis]